MQVTKPSYLITEVIFTGSAEGSNLPAWFGSSGGGLPRRPDLKSSGRFLFLVASF
jgi:hypothetical protein